MKDVFVRLGAKINTIWRKYIVNPRSRIIVFVFVFAAMGALLIFITRASTPNVSVEVENGQAIGSVVAVNDDITASASGYVAFSPIKLQIKGVVDRDPYNFNKAVNLQNVDIPANYEQIVNNFVLKIDWSRIQPNSQNDFATTHIDDAISEAKAKNMRIKLRVMAGIHAPGWAKQIDGGPFTAYDIDKVTGEVFTGSSPKYWTINYKNAYDQLMSKLAGRYDSNNTVGSVVNSMCTTIFAEPFIKNLGDVDPSTGQMPNMTSFYNAGLTDTLDKDCHNNSVDVHAQNWKRTRTETAINPLSYKGTNSSDEIVEKFDPDFSIAWIERCRQVLGERCIMGNNGFNATSGPAGSNYRRVIGAIICQGNPPPYFQSRQWEALQSSGKTLEEVIQYGINVGAGMIEMPYEYKTTATTPQKLAPLDTALESNNAIPCPADRLLPNPL